MLLSGCYRNHKLVKLLALASTFILLLQVDCLIFPGRPPLHQSKRFSDLRLHASRKIDYRGQRNQLHRVIRSMEYYGKYKDGTDKGASNDLLEAMKALLQARNQREIKAVGRRLDKLDIIGGESYPIQERVVKATALSGLLTTSLTIVNGMLDSNYLPSQIAYIPVCSALRRADEIQQLEDLMYNLAETARQQQTSVDVVAWNIYLAALCDSVDDPNDPILGIVWKWMDPAVARDQFSTEPDQISFNTLIFAAARAGNKTLVEKVWEEMQKQDGFEQTIRAYNSRLMVSDKEERLAIFDEICATKSLTPDRYTVDLLLYPLIQVGRMGDVETLVENFIASSSERMKRDAFSAFLSTLIKEGDVTSARALFDTYVERQSSVPASTRHFNILIDGYRRLAESTAETNIQKENSETSQQPKEKDGEKKMSSEDNEGERSLVLAEARKLYQRMLELEIPPDAYTLSSMMLLCTSSDEILRSIEKSDSQLLTPAVIRSAMTQSGRLGDPSLACQLFDQFVFPSMNVREWNVLLGALAEGAKQGNLILDVSSATIWNEISTKKAGISSSLDGLSCSEACQVLLNMMSSTTQKTKAPYPNSQTYCLAASALQYGTTDRDLALTLFRNATNTGIPADGRFLNAVFRCFGDDIGGALESWKNEIRRACLERESQTTKVSLRNKNLVAAYNGLLYVCGRALRPDIAVRLAYAMNKEGIEADKNSLNNYNAGKRARGQSASGGEVANTKVWSKLFPKPNMVQQYESLLYVECSKYDPNRKSMSSDKRVRIIV